MLPSCAPPRQWFPLFGLHSATQEDMRQAAPFCKAKVIIMIALQGRVERDVVLYLKHVFKKLIK
jgi:hypothetical protein